MTFYKKLFFALMVLAMGFSGGVFAQIWFTPAKAEASNSQVLRMYNQDGQERLQLGTYDGSQKRSEKGLPFIGFSDNDRQLRLLFRLAGPNQSPVLVFKDTNHRDRMVIGLAMADGDEEPFIAFFDESGDKHLLMGEFPS